MTKITIARETLLAPLKTTAPLAAGKSTLPVLNHALIDVRPSSLTVTCSDLESEIVASTGCQTDGDWSVCVPHRKLFDIARLLPAGAEIDIEPVEPNKLRVKSGRSRFTLTTLPASSFPAFDRHGFVRTLTTEPAKLERQMAAVAHAMAVSDVRFYLNGMLLQLLGDELVAVASDNCRLAIYRAGGFPPSDDISCIVPRFAASEIIKALRSTTADRVEIHLGTNSVQIDLGSVRLATKVIEGRYPDYNQVIPRDFTSECRVGRAAMIAAAQRVGLPTAGDKCQGMALCSTDSGLSLSSTTNADASAEDYVDAEFTGDPLRLGFNVDYVLQALGEITADTALMQFAATGRCLITDPADPALTLTVSPMKL
jgi:DNA polymerase-3 subunit beta